MVYEIKNGEILRNILQIVFKNDIQTLFHPAGIILEMTNLGTSRMRCLPPMIQGEGDCICLRPPLEHVLQSISAENMVMTFCYATKTVEEYWAQEMQEGDQI